MSGHHDGPHIVMIGTSSAGGVSTVLDIYRNAGLFQQWNIEFIPTHKSIDAGFSAKLWTAVSALSRFCAVLVRRRVTLLHAHTSSRASFWRKSVFVLLSKAAGVPVVIHIHSGEFTHFYFNESGAIAKWYVRKILNHADSSIGGIYDRHTYWQEKMAAAKQWSDRLAVILSEDETIVELTA